MHRNKVMNNLLMKVKKFYYQIGFMDKRQKKDKFDSVPAAENSSQK